MSPVLAKPVCTSSAINKALFSLAHLDRALKNPGAGTMNPPSP